VFHRSVRQFNVLSVVVSCDACAVSMVLYILCEDKFISCKVCVGSLGIMLSVSK
jgi:hypothetical protein